MKLQEFQLKAKREQWELLHERGVFLNQIVESCNTFSLYSFDRFYVEVKFSLLEGEIISLRSFDIGPSIDRYLHRTILLFL